MNHLTENSIQKLAYAYVKRTKLTEMQAGFKRHLADCDSCFGRFLVEWKLQEALLGSGLISEDAMKIVLGSEEAVSERILLRMKKAFNELQLIMEQAKEKTDSLWDFYLSPQTSLKAATVRGSEEQKKTVMYENVMSECSMICLNEAGLLIRLDKQVFGDARFILKVTREDKIDRIPFKYDEKEGIFEVYLEGGIESGTVLEIVEDVEDD